MDILVLNNVSKSFQGLVAIDNVSAAIPAGEITCIIGPNGAGKSTLFNLITGGYPLSGGQILFNGTKISGYKPNQIQKIGISRTFQNIRLFGSMTVLENVMVGAHSLPQHQFKLPKIWGRTINNNEAEAMTRAEECLKIVGLLGQVDELATSLPYGAQRRLEIARAIVSSPKLLLLDEPAAGMNTSEANELKKLIVSLMTNLGITIVIIEHNMRLVMSISNNIIVLDHGIKIAEGTPHNIVNNPSVVEAYLGTSKEANGPSKEEKIHA